MLVKMLSTTITLDSEKNRKQAENFETFNF